MCVAGDEASRKSGAACFFSPFSLILSPCPPKNPPARSHPPTPQNEQYQRLVAEAKAGSAAGHTAGGGGGGASSHLNASSVAASYLALKKADPKRAAAFLKEAMTVKENATETVVNAAVNAAIDAAGRLFNITFG
jgi:hypothetical protein